TSFTRPFCRSGAGAATGHRCRSRHGGELFPGCRGDPAKARRHGGSYNGPMISVIQRVSSASVAVAGETVGAIGPGLLALVAVEPGDGEAQVERMARRLLGYRVFGDDRGRMNRSLADVGGGLLLVSQFTLAADTGSG